MWKSIGREFMPKQWPPNLSARLTRWPPCWDCTLCWQCTAKWAKGQRTAGEWCQKCTKFAHFCKEKHFMTVRKNGRRRYKSEDIEILEEAGRLRISTKFLFFTAQILHSVWHCSFSSLKLPFTVFPPLFLLPNHSQKSRAISWSSLYFYFMIFNQRDLAH